MVDNDKKKNGMMLSNFFGDFLDEKHKKIKISDASGLLEYDKNDIVVLITSLLHLEQIYEQLNSMGIPHIFSLLTMEANRRENKEAVINLKKEEIIEKNISENKVIFYTMGGYSGHGKYIVEKMLKIRRDLDIVWLVDDLSVCVPDGIRLIYSKDRKKCMHEMYTAKIWAFEWLVPLDIKKQDGQIYIQLKHWPSITLKKFGFDVIRRTKSSEYVNLWKYNSKLIDYIMVGSKFDENSCRRGFGFDGKVEYTGSARSDVLFDSLKVKKMVYQKYDISVSCKTVLYAPTYRSVGKNYSVPSSNNIDLNFEKIKLILEERFGGKWLILLRLHPLVAVDSDNIDKPQYVIDVSDYSDSQELVAAADIMVTDYSSIMFEPSFVKKPVFLYAQDKKTYIDAEAELLIKYDTLPFPIAETNEELVKNIENFDQQIYEENVTEFLEEYGVHEDGHASKRAAEFIVNLLKE